MTKFKLLLLFAGFVFITSCSDPKSKKPEETSTAAELSLDDINGLLSEIDGCSCYFSETEEKFKNKQFVFATDLDSTGFIAVENKLVKLKQISTTREPDTFGTNDHVDVYSSENYKVTVSIKYKHSNGDETWWNEGTLTIETKDGQKVIKKFVGECGC